MDQIVNASGKTTPPRAVDPVRSHGYKPNPGRPEQPLVLVADKDLDFAESFKEALASTGIKTVLARTAQEATTLAKLSPNLCLAFVDAQIPATGGLALMQQLHHLDPSLTVILMSASGSPVAVVEATQRGAEDYIIKPFEFTEVVEKARCFLELFQGQLTAEGKDVPANPVRGLEDVICSSQAMQQVLARAKQASCTEVSVLIVGERGVGKSILARAIHAASSRTSGPFLRIDCASIAHGLPVSDSQHSAPPGNSLQPLFEATANGTIFLSEVGELPRTVQNELLDTIDTKAARKQEPGASLNPGPRVLASSTRSLADLKHHHLCAELYSLLAGVTLEVPPLRNRPEDILPLAKHFLRRLAGRYNQQFVLSWSGLDLLLSYSLPGNVRELECILERVAAHLLQVPRRVSDGDLRLFLDHNAIPLERAVPDDSPMDLSRVEQLAIERALWFAKGNRTRAAALLGIDRTTLYSKLRRLNKGIGAN